MLNTIFQKNFQNFWSEFLYETKFKWIEKLWQIVMAASSLFGYVGRSLHGHSLGRQMGLWGFDTRKSNTTIQLQLLSYFFAEFWQPYLKIRTLSLLIVLIGALGVGKIVTTLSSITKDILDQNMVFISMGSKFTWNFPPLQPLLNRYPITHIHC